MVIDDLDQIHDSLELIELQKLERVEQMKIVYGAFLYSSLNIACKPF